MTAETSNLPDDVAQQIAQEAVQRARRSMLGAYEEMTGELQSQDKAHAEAARQMVTELYHSFSESPEKTVHKDVHGILHLSNGVRIFVERNRTTVNVPMDPHKVLVQSDRGIMQIHTEASSVKNYDHRLSATTVPNSVIAIDT